MFVDELLTFHPTQDTHIHMSVKTVRLDMNVPTSIKRQLGIRAARWSKSSGKVKTMTDVVVDAVRKTGRRR